MRIGVPRALMYYEFYPLWRTFLERLGLEVVTSDRTSKAVLERGVALAADEACLPVKLALGHVVNLAGRCEAIFLPRLITIEPNGFLCPKIVGFPDMVRALPVECPPLVDACVDMDKNPDPLRPFVSAARQLGKSASLARAAYAEASRVQEGFLESVRAGRLLRSALEDFERGRILPPDEVREAAGARAAGAGRLRLALLGHPYNIHDPYLSMDLAQRLEALGCEVVPIETIPASPCRRALERFGQNVYWVFGRRVLGPVLHLMDEPTVDGLVYVVSFGCGPDALLKALVDLWAKKRPELPYMSVVLDEHSGETGLLTRLEAFVDMTRRVRAGKAGGRGGRPGGAGAFGEGAREDLFTLGLRMPVRSTNAVGFPHAGIIWIPLRAMIEDMGIRCVVPPQSTRRTLDIGSAHSPELACLPFKLMLGNYVEALERGATHLLGITSRFGASCRLYFFPPVHEAILRDLGYDFEMVALKGGSRDSPTGVMKYTRARVGKSIWRFVKLFFATFARKLLACERVEKLAAEARAFALDPDEATRVMRRALRKVDSCEPRRLRRLLHVIEDEFRSIERDTERRPLRIGLVGELFVLLDSFANHNIEERLGRMGVLVKRNFWASKKLLRSIWRHFDPEYARAMKAASRYFGVDIGAECNVTVGDAVEYRREGFDGLVHLMPFTCMPEIVAESVLPRAKAESGMPVITFALDEQTSDAGMETRLEAFVDLLRRQRDRHPLGRRRGSRGALSCTR